MPEYSRFQKKVIERYYDRRDQIMLEKLGEIVSELYVTDGKGKLDRLWKRAETAMNNLKVPPRLSEHILTSRDPAVLAANLKDWLEAASKS